MIIDGQIINKELRIENTNRCNAKCVICPRDKMVRPLATMPWNVFCALVLQGVQLGVETVSVFGYGEPLMDVELEKKIGYCADNGLETWITTNGSLLKQYRAYDLINAGLKNIRFSVHAATPVNYEKVHVNLEWGETLRNISNFIHINNRAGHPVTTHMSVIPMNGESVDHLVKMWEGFVDHLEIWKPHNWGGKKHYREVEPQKRTCMRPFNGPIQVQADGDVIPCCFLTDAEIVLGNIHDSALLDILVGEKYERLREMHYYGEYNNVPCETCDQRNIEDENPLLYSSRDPNKEIGKTSTTKFNLEDKNGIHTENDKHDSDSRRAHGFECGADSTEQRNGGRACLCALEELQTGSCLHGDDCCGGQPGGSGD